MPSGEPKPVEYRPAHSIDTLADADREAERVRSELGWGLGAFIGVFDEDLQWVLLSQLGDYCAARYGGRPWTLPGGAVHEGETASSAALRELLEETGIAPESGTLRPAAVFARPYFQTRMRNNPGELIVLFAAIGHPDDPALRPNPPETEAAEWHLFSLDRFLSLPTTGSGEYLQPMPRHWGFWSAVAHMVLADPLRAPLHWTYPDKDALPLPPWTPVTNLAPQAAASIGESRVNKPD